MKIPLSKIFTMKKLFLVLVGLVMMCNFAAARQPQRGYRGFVEWSNSTRNNTYGVFTGTRNIATYRENNFYTGVTTSHGYQINPLFFIGAGVGMEKCTNLNNWIVPLFVEGRVDLKFGKFTPFGDIRLGASLSEGAGVYFSPTIGYRFNWGRKIGINLGAGLSLVGYKVENYAVIWPTPDDLEFAYHGTKHHVRPYFSFRLGIDF